MGDAEAERFQDLLKLATRESPFSAEGFDTANTEWNSIKLLVVGAGGLGCELLHCLALSGFTDIHCIDMDTIDLSNLNRQFLFRNDDIGKPKADVAAAFINKRCPWVTVTPHFGRIEDKDDDFYRGFQMCILGLDSIHARTWINQKLASLSTYEIVDDKPELAYSIPLIDGGTEGFKGSCRVILFGKTACINCTLWLFPPQRGVPMCTLENVPRVPAHCVLYVKEKTWGDEKPFGADKDGVATKVDGDEVDHIIWIMNKAKERQERFKLEGNIDFGFTQGVVKNVIPAVGFTNALVAAMCVNEALKMATGMAKNMDCFAFYDGSKAGVASSVNVMLADESCPVCQIHSTTIDPAHKPQEVIDSIFNNLKEVINSQPEVKVDYTKTDNVFDIQLIADLGDDVRVPLRQIGPLAFKTEEAMKQSVKQTLTEAVKANGKELAGTVMLECSGGLLKNNIIWVMGRLK